MPWMVDGMDCAAREDERSASRRPLPEPMERSLQSWDGSVDVRRSRRGRERERQESGW